MMFLYVLPNPFTVLDSEGQPCGFTFTDPMKGRPFQVVGGTLTKTVIPHEDEAGDPQQKDPADVRPPRVKVRNIPALTVQRVVNTEYHRSRIACGDLVAADLPTYQAAGGSKKTFLPPVDVIAAARSARVDEWRAERGEDPPCADVALMQEGEDLSATIRFVAADATGGGVVTPKQNGAPVIVHAQLTATPVSES